MQENNRNIHERIEKLLRFLNSELYGKEEVVRLSLLSLIAGESLFFLGPPGTAKSMIARRLKAVFKDDTKFFEYLLNEFSTPDEIFGPISLKELENDVYQRKTEGYLPKTDVAFLDEIWKAGPAILNTLLTIVNEKKFHNGDVAESVPLKALIAASNELPAKNKGLEALWDRFVLRVIVDPITNEDNFFKMVQQRTNTDAEFKAKGDMVSNLITVNELEEWRKKIDIIDIPDNVREIISAIRKELIQKNESGKEIVEDEKYYISDRRWKKIIHLLRTSAYLNGRQKVDLMDASLIADCIWSTDKQQTEVKEIVQNLIKEYGLECNTAIEDINDQIENFDYKIKKTWYGLQKTDGQEIEPIIQTHPDDEDIQCYKVKYGSEGIFYFEIEPWEDYAPRYKRHRYWKSLKEDYVSYADNVVISNDKKTITTNKGTFTIQWSKDKSSEKLIKNTAFFDNSLVYEATKEKIDSEDYQPIVDNITREFTKLVDYEKKQEVSFRSNLFGNPHFADIILSKIDSSKKDLEDARVELDKLQALYSKE